MEGNKIYVINSVLWGVGILLLLAAAFDLLTLSDNTAIFLALACLIIGGVIKKITKGTGSCCK